MFFSKPVLVKLIPQVQNNLTQTETINKKPIQIKQMKKKQQHKCRFKTEEGRTLFSLTFGKNAGATFISS